MRIVVAHVNTTGSVAEAIRRQAVEAAAEGTEILAVTPSFGPESVEGDFESYLAAVAVMDRVTALDEPFDAIVLAGFGEHGKAGLADRMSDRVGMPVVDGVAAGRCWPRAWCGSACGLRRSGVGRRRGPSR